LKSVVQLNGDMPDTLGNSILSKFAKSGRVPHALLFTGLDREGMARAARNFAKQLLHGEEEGPAAVGAGHPDFLYIDDETPSIRQIRSIKKRLALSTFSGTQKIVLITHADAMRKEAANALLKVLEEPRGETLFILIGRSYSSFYPTVSSRACEIRFGDRATREKYAADISKRCARVLERIQDPALHVRFRECSSYNLKNKDALLTLLDAWLLSMRKNLATNDAPETLYSLKQIFAAKTLLRTSNANPQLILEQLLIAN